MQYVCGWNKSFLRRNYHESVRVLRFEAEERRRRRVRHGHEGHAAVYHEITTAWDWADLNPEAANDVPNLNLTVASLVLSSNIELTVGKHSWSLIEDTLSQLGFVNLKHHYFGLSEKVNHPAMAFGRSAKPFGGKYVVAAVYRGSSSMADVVSDAKAEPKGFRQAGVHATSRLKEYLESQRLTADNTILLITGHSYGAACSALVGIMSADAGLAKRGSIFCYSFATPNYIREGLTGAGMKMFSFDSNEDVVPQVPVGLQLDKTGVDVTFDRLDSELNDPERYARFSALYQCFRGADFEDDRDFLPKEYSFKLPVRIPLNTVIIRNHMPYTYMSLILSELPDEVAYAYIGR